MNVGASALGAHVTDTVIDYVTIEVTTSRLVQGKSGPSVETVTQTIDEAITTNGTQTLLQKTLSAPRTSTAPATAAQLAAFAASTNPSLTQVDVTDHRETIQTTYVNGGGGTQGILGISVTQSTIGSLHAAAQYALIASL